MMFRIEPAMPAGNYITYSWSRPLSTHWRRAQCHEVNCGAYLNGWVTRVNEAETLGASQAHYIRHDNSRTHTEYRSPEGLTCFEFPAGQTCFAADRHRMPVEREPHYLVRGGDWRGNPTGMTRVHKYVDDFIEDWSEHQDQLAEQIKRG